MWQPELHDGFVRLIDGARHVDFHLVWLRDAVGQAAPTIELDELCVDDGVLRIRWAADHKLSRFPIAWLLQQAYALGREAAAPPPSQVALLELRGDISVVDRALALVDAHGAAVIRHESRDPISDAWTDALVERGLVPLGSAELAGLAAPTAHPKELGGSDAIEIPAGLAISDGSSTLQLLHVLEAHSGELLLADAHVAFEYLESIDVDAARRLLSTPTRPGERPHLPFAEVEAWFRARDRFAAIVRDPRHHYRVRVRAGEVVLFDRNRILYGQTAGERTIRRQRFAREDVTG